MRLPRLLRCAIVLGAGAGGLALVGAPGLFCAPALAAESADAVTAPLQALSAGLAKAEKLSDYKARVAIVGPLIDRAFDLPAVLKASVGLRYNSIPADQKQELLTAFHDFTVARYLSNFAAGSDTGLEVHDATPYAAIPGAQLVHTQITSGGSGTDVNYVVHQGPTGWQATDVLLDGTISQVAVQRSDFTAQFAQGGAPALIAGLKKKVAALSGS
ncbi:phospholipid transport system substrate-binding protein [Endobacter medicaginis]|uniref:ABC transporter substrate-binding protein n=1 Tax=Endobacter medicaginis TaxID=1181271 RepID=A0A839UZN5_9PROT|nr:ABC transporter substrate-binding protein [Endobacter medicaginis]MBB3173853.1 phospholipid transport system substrate-binding protein [Endobacter medicaginis]MCX5476135.1 ABC transporter substrate-binding protein [Endobacter medicaginis]NVN29156.1 ABC transporter substrate-binding protein [Endobacter medicaginis]